MFSFAGSETNCDYVYGKASVMIKESDPNFAFYLARLCLSVHNARMIRTQLKFIHYPTYHADIHTFDEVIYLL